MSKPRDHRMSSRPVDRPGIRPMAATTAHDQNHRSKSNNKIPKEIRYDLENALLGLCDVWFDEIKPHLVRNKLKVHTGGALRDEYDPRTMADRRQATNSERGNLDPGAAPYWKIASCNVSSQTRRVASRELWCKRPVPSYPKPTSPQKIRNFLEISDDEWTPEPLRPARRRPPETPTLTKTHQRNVHNSSKESIRKRKSREKSSIQKEPQSPISTQPYPSRIYPYCTACASSSPSNLRAANISPQRFPSRDLSSTPHRSRADKHTVQSTTPSPPRKPSIVDQVPSKSPKSQIISRAREKPKSSLQVPTNDKSFTIRNLNTVLSHPAKHERKKELKDDTSTLYPKDLINLISEKNEERLKILYKNPNREKSNPSIMCLLPSRATTNKK